MTKMDSDLVIFATVVPTIIPLIHAGRVMSVSILTNRLLSIDKESEQFRLGFWFQHQRSYGLHSVFYYTVNLLKMSQHIQV